MPYGYCILRDCRDPGPINQIDFPSFVTNSR
jgi:hypothetical protein